MSNSVSRYPDEVRCGAVVDYLLGRSVKAINIKWGLSDRALDVWLRRCPDFKRRGPGMPRKEFKGVSVELETLKCVGGALDGQTITEDKFHLIAHAKTPEGSEIISSVYVKEWDANRKPYWLFER